MKLITWVKLEGHNEQTVRRWARMYGRRAAKNKALAAMKAAENA